MPSQKYLWEQELVAKNLPFAEEVGIYITPLTRTILKLYFGLEQEKMTVKEIAVKLGLTESTVRSRISYGIADADHIRWKHSHIEFRSAITVSFSEIDKCPKHILSPNHWIPEHHIEECHDDLRILVKEKEKELSLKRKALLNALEIELEDYKKELREGYGDNSSRSG